MIQNDLGSNPCEASEKQENELGWGEVTAVVYVGANQTNDNVAGTALNISSLLIQVGHKGQYGLATGPISGAGQSVSKVKVWEPNQGGIRIGAEYLPVTGTSGSPVQVVDNVVEYSWMEGIVAEGSHIRVAENEVNETSAHGIAAYGKTMSYIEIAHNTIIGSSWGASLDGSFEWYEKEGGKEVLKRAVGEHNSVYDNTIEDTCVGAILYRQVDASVAGNYFADPETGWTPKGHEQGCPEFEPTGIAVSNSYDNGIWSNQVWNFNEGVRLFDGGNSPGGVGTHWNYVGRVLEIGQPWPWPIEGNWINYPVTGLVAKSPDPPNDDYNEFAGNAVDYAKEACYVDSFQYLTENNFSACG